jgi:hypothetical protein
LRIVAAVSGIYDLLVGVLLLTASNQLAALFSVPPPTPPIHSTLNGLFLVAVGTGYWLPYRAPDVYRGYLWVMGPLLKGGGAAVFIVDYFLRGSPASFLLFAISDGTLAVWTLWALLSGRRGGSRTAPTPAIAASRNTAAGPRP